MSTSIAGCVVWDPREQTRPPRGHLWAAASSLEPWIAMDQAEVKLHLDLGRMGRGGPRSAQREKQESRAHEPHGQKDKRKTAGFGGGGMGHGRMVVATWILRSTYHNTAGAGYNIAYHIATTLPKRRRAMTSCRAARAAEAARAAHMLPQMRLYATLYDSTRLHVTRCYCDRAPARQHCYPLHPLLPRRTLIMPGPRSTARYCIASCPRAHSPCPSKLQTIACPLGPNATAALAATATVTRY